MSIGRNKEFLASLQHHGASVLGGAMVISAAPNPLKPIVGTIIRQVCLYYSNKGIKMCMPLVQQRLDETARAKKDPSYSWDPPVSHPPLPCLLFLFSLLHLQSTHTDE
jgi:hypothetical protein